MNSDVTRVKFPEKVVWGKNNKFKVIDEQRLEWSVGILFSCTAVPGRDSNKLKDFLIEKFDLYWVKPENLEFKKSTDKKRINLSNETDSLSIILMDEDTNGTMVIDDKGTYEYITEMASKATLVIDNIRFYDFIVKKEKNNLNIYVDIDPAEIVGLGSVMAIYRNLRENYEYRLRYDEAGEFFIREMELKRKYMETHLENGLKVKPNGFFRRNFSLTGLYYHISKYGEGLIRPTLLSVIFVSISILFWLLHFHTINHLSLSYEGLTHIGNATERSLTTFIPLRSEHLVWQDYIIKSLGALSLGVLIIALRRKFERKLRH